MNLRTIVFNNLLRRKSRVVFLVAGLMLGIATVVTLLVLSAALTMEAQHELESFGANILLTPSNEELSLSYGGITLGGVAVDQQEIAQGDLTLIRTIPNRRNIAIVAPKVLGAVTVGEIWVLLMGVVPDQEFLLKRWWQVDGRPLAAADELVAGSAAAQRLALRVGQRLQLDGAEFTVTGILQETGAGEDNLLLGSLAAVQQLLNKQGQVSLVEVAALCADCPVEDIVNQLAAVLPGVKVKALQQVVKTRMQALEQFRVFSLGVAGVVILVGGLVVLVTMMGAVNERTREIGIFRALGFRRTHVMALVLLEAALVSLTAGLIGYLVGQGTARAILPLLGTGTAHVMWSPLLGAGALMLALSVGLLASIYPALQASRMDPAEALRSL